MKSIQYCTILFLLLGFQNLYGQCDFITPPAVKRINFATREVTFTNVTMNGKQTTYLAVEKGERVKIKTDITSKKKGDYCPNCIVQIYWGIRGYTSVCAKSFHGYRFNKNNSTLKFDAPMEDGIYYITMGATLDYSCKNNKYRPSCSANDAFAVLKVGNPDSEQKITFQEVRKGTTVFLKANLIKSGCFGDLNKIEWFLDDQKLAYDNKDEIPLTQFGNYKVVWSNCLASATSSFNHTSEKKSVPSLSMNGITEPEENKERKEVVSFKIKTGSSVPEPTEMAVLMENNDKFVLKNLLFDLSKSDIKPKAKKDLDELAQILKNKPSMRILLEGHTDVRGSARKNQVLSEERVESTKAYLVEQGVNKSNIETKGWGHQKPLIITNNVEEGKINRRVEVTILSR